MILNKKRSSEFAHPDVLIGLTIMAYRIQGLRMSDLRIVVNMLKTKLTQEPGPENLRDSSVKFDQWIRNEEKLLIKFNT